MDRATQNILIENLLARLEFNDRASTWKLSGSMSKAEVEALRELLYESRERERSET